MRRLLLALLVLLCFTCADQTINESISNVDPTTVQIPTEGYLPGPNMPQPGPLPKDCNERMEVFWYNCYIILCDYPCLPGDGDCFHYYCEWAEPGANPRT